MEQREKRLKDAMENYMSLLLYVAYSYTGNAAESEDLVQDVFLAYYQKAPKFRDTEHEKAWLLKVTANRCKNFLKSGWFKKVLLGEEPLHTKIETHSEVMEAVLQLPVKYREVVCLHYVAGYSIRETAALLHRNPTTVGTQLERARKKLKLELEE